MSTDLRLSSFPEYPQQDFMTFTVGANGDFAVLSGSPQSNVAGTSPTQGLIIKNHGSGDVYVNKSSQANVNANIGYLLKPGEEVRFSVPKRYGQTSYNPYSDDEYSSGGRDVCVQTPSAGGSTQISVIRTTNSREPDSGRAVLPLQ